MNLDTKQHVILLSLIVCIAHCTKYDDNNKASKSPYNLQKAKELCLSQGIENQDCKNGLGVCNGVKKKCHSQFLTNLPAILQTPENGTLEIPATMFECTDEYIKNSVSNYETNETSCDNADNDCDGEIDEIFCGVCLPVTQTNNTIRLITLNPSQHKKSFLTIGSDNIIYITQSEKSADGHASRMNIFSMKLNTYDDIHPLLNLKQWKLEQIDFITSSGKGIIDKQLLIDNSGKRHFIYTIGDSNNLEKLGLDVHYLFETSNGSWEHQVIDQQPETGYFFDSTIDNNGNIHLIYFQRFENYLTKMFYATKSHDSSTFVQKNAPENNTNNVLYMYYPRIKIDHEGNIHVLYLTFQENQFHLKYALYETLLSTPSVTGTLISGDNKSEGYDIGIISDHYEVVFVIFQGIINNGLNGIHFQSGKTELTDEPVIIDNREYAGIGVELKLSLDEMHVLYNVYEHNRNQLTYVFSGSEGGHAKNKLIQTILDSQEYATSKKPRYYFSPGTDNKGAWHLTYFNNLPIIEEDEKKDEEKQQNALPTVTHEQKYMVITSTACTTSLPANHLNITEIQFK